MFNNPLIPGDPYSYDLKWIVRKIKEYGVFIEGAPATIEALINDVIMNMSLPTEYINAKYPGHGLQGVKGDGQADDTAAFKAIVGYCIANNKPLYVPVDVDILLTDDVKIYDLHNVIIQGNIKGDSLLTLTLAVKATNSDPVIWNVNSIEGIRLQIEGVKNGLVRIQYADTVRLYAEGGTDYYSIAYNTFLLGTIGDLILEGTSGGSVGGWINSNVFLGGRILNTITFADSRYNHNGNVFYGTLFEGSSKLQMYCGANNAFLDSRGEAVSGYYFSLRAVGNIVVNAYAAHSPFVRLPNPNANDQNGSNLVLLRGINELITNSLTLSAKSGTFDVANIVKGADNKLTAIYSTNEVMETDLIDISTPVYISFNSDATLWRIRVLLYDENRNQITVQPQNCIYGGSLTWTNSGYNSGATLAADGYGFARVLNGVDTGVHYIKVLLRTYGNGDFEHLTANITVLPTHTPVRFKYSSEKIKGSARPTSGTWTAGDMVYSTDPNTLNYMGWICSTSGSPGSWRKAGELGT